MGETLCYEDVAKVAFGRIAYFPGLVLKRPDKEFPPRGYANAIRDKPANLVISRYAALPLSGIDSIKPSVDVKRENCVLFNVQVRFDCINPNKDE